MTPAPFAGFHPLDDLEEFRSFVPPITPFMTFPYEIFDKIPYPVYGGTQTPFTRVLEEHLAVGIDDGLVRLSVGLENNQDIISDINDALDLLP